MTVSQEKLISLFGNPQPVAVVTGSGADRVGKTVALSLAEHGYRIALHANSSLDEAEETAAMLRERDIEAKAFVADLADEAAVHTMFDSIHFYFGRIDVLVNTAAIWSPLRFDKVTAADLRQQLDVNTVGTFLCCQAAGRRMIDQPKGGAIINIGDWSMVRPYPDYANYFPSKGAIPTMTRSLAVELATRNPGIRVNAILPGQVMQPPDASEEKIARDIARTLVKRQGEPEYLAHAVLFLAENPFVTGVCLPVDGGRTIYAGDEFGASS
ncbi:SDR family NAD(P)-dependent oxidoreductase [Blastopirellula marina]|uniref:Pteridine reductase 1-possibly short-chain dehydrogenase n=1 Tax=Blastopirellula marina DSM 3645 TaxID=314230 RepID=A3ZTX9_9BACT|nr:SDR family oxidoreductase [Blastopirellula marina]EAQ80037.1 pteridine reductase 1-possibly short-chain dehydrogenase [Blastopirellula marina DSM 3645]